jgi:hypothetical protein
MVAVVCPQNWIDVTKIRGRILIGWKKKPKDKPKETRQPEDDDDETEMKPGKRLKNFKSFKTRFFQTFSVIRMRQYRSALLLLCLKFFPNKISDAILVTT